MKSITGNELIGKHVTSRCKDSWANGKWGVVRYFDGEFYHVALYDGKSCLIFSRKEIRILK